MAKAVKFKAAKCNIDIFAAPLTQLTFTISGYTAYRIAGNFRWGLFVIFVVESPKTKILDSRLL